MYSTINRTKWGRCSVCGGAEQEVVKVKKELFCLNCRNAQKAEEQIKKANRRTAARNAGNKLRRENILGNQYSEDYEAAERSALVHDIDFVFSRCVRMMYADSAGLCSCYTCFLVQHWSMNQCGHFIKRGNTAVRWDFRNAKPQCRKCNENLHGNLEVYEKYLEMEHPGLPDQLKEISREPYKWSRDELKQLLIDLRAKLKIIEQKFKPSTT